MTGSSTDDPTVTGATGGYTCPSCGALATNVLPDRGRRCRACRHAWTGRSPQATGPTRHYIARAIAEAADDGVFDRDEPDSESDAEDRAFWLRLADALGRINGQS